MHLNNIKWRWSTFACKLDIDTWNWMEFRQHLNWSVAHANLILEHEGEWDFGKKIKWKWDPHFHANLILTHESVWPTFACKLDISTWKWIRFRQRLNGSMTHIWMQTWYWHVKNGILAKIKWKCSPHLHSNLILACEC